MRLAGWVEVVVVVVAAAAVVVAVTGAVIESVTGFVKGYSGRYLDGDVAVTLEGVSLVQCAAACGPRRVFNVRGSWPDYICYILSSFTAFVEDPRYSVYYDEELYRGSGFFPALGRSLFMPPPSSPKVSWLAAYWACKDMWTVFLVPHTQAEWEGMKQEAASVGVEGIWMGLQEGEEASNTYYWVGMYMSDAPGPVDITIPDDGVTTYRVDTNGLSVLEDDYDCGALVEPSVGQQVAITSCYDPLYSGYICEALFPPL